VQTRLRDAAQQFVQLVVHRRPVPVLVLVWMRVRVWVRVLVLVLRTLQTGHPWHP
jgi:hypothetical protein